MAAVKNQKYLTNDEDNIGSIIDHLKGYPKLYNYTLRLDY